MAALAQAGEEYTAAEREDAANARSLQLIEWMTGTPAFPDLPDSLKEPAEWAKWTTADGQEALKGSIFDTGNAARQSIANERSYQAALDNLRLPVAQGMLDAVEAGKSNWPRDAKIPAEIVHNGRIVLETPSDHARFSRWFERIERRKDSLYGDGLQPGFDHETFDRKDTWSK